MNKRKNSQKGITLVALVITIVIMIVLAGISLNAIVGENGIVSSVLNAKIDQEDSSEKENIQFAWSARMTRFYEDIASGKAKPEDIYKYFNETEVNAMLGGTGKVHAMTYDKEKNTFDISYVGSNGVPYLGEVKPTGEIVKLERAEKATTEVWASFYEDYGILTYASSKDIKLNGKEPGYQWEITEELCDHSEIQNSMPWETLLINGKDGFNIISYLIKEVQILDEIIPKDTSRLFYDFQYCERFQGLEKVNYSYYKKIGENQFGNCVGLTSIEIPNNITTIGKGAFINCINLQNVTLNNNIQSLEYGCFENCLSFTEIEIPNNVKSIEAMAFAGCENLSNVKLSENLNLIGDGCFYRCIELTNIVLPNSLKIIESEAFLNAGLTKIRIPESVEILGADCFWGCDNLTVVEYNAINAKSFGYISENTFYDIPFSDTVSNITIGPSVRTLGDGIFALSSIQNITIPSNVKSIGRYAFYGCENLETINYNATNANETNLLNNRGYVEGAFEYAGTDDLVINIGGNVTYIPDFLFCFSSVATLNIISPSLAIIGKQTFWACENLIDVEIPASVTTISQFAFWECEYLETITVNKNKGSIADAPWTDVRPITIIWNDETEDF